MNVLLILPHDPNIVFPIGLSYVAAITRAAGHKVTTLDMALFQISPNRFSDIIRGVKFDVAGIAGIITQYKQIEWLAAEARRLRPDARVVAGGPGVSSAYDIFLKHNPLDACFVGEAEISFPKYLRAIEEGSDETSVDGVYVLAEGGIIQGTRSRIVENLDTLPLPAWDLFQMEAYLKRQDRYLIGPEMPVFTARGCPHRCIFCGIGQDKVRFHSTERTMREIRILHEEYGISTFRFMDADFMMNERHTEQLCDALIDYGKPVYWQCQARADFKNHGLLRKFYQAGCRGIVFGMESGSPLTLSNLRKNLDVQQARETLNKARESGLRVLMGFLLDSPGETRETIRETVAFIHEFKDIRVSFAYLYPFPGTELWDMALRGGHIPDALEYLRELKDGNSSQVVNLTALSQAELNEELIHVRRQRTPIKEFRYTQKQKLALFGERVAVREDECSLLHRDFPALLFFHPGEAGIYSDKKYCALLKNDIKKIEKMLEVLSRSSAEVALSGAEPTEHPDFEKIISLPIFDSFTRVRLISNGHKLCDMDFLDLILDHYINEFVIILPGADAQIFGLHSKMQWSFSKTCQAVRNIISRGFQPLISVPLTRFNMKHLQEFAHLARELQFNMIQFCYNPVNSGENPADVFPDLETLRGPLETALDMCPPAGIRIRVDGVPPCVLGRHENLYSSKTVPIRIETTDPPVKNPIFGNAFKQGQLCNNCAQKIRCAGIESLVYKLYGWRGLAAMK